MNVRQWLGRARGIDGEIASLEENLEKARASATRVTQNYEADGSQSSKDPHKFDRIVEYADFIREKLDELYGVKKEIAEVIYQIPNSRQRQALDKYYVGGKKWEEVAVEMHYNYSRVMDFRRAGIDAVGKILRERGVL